MARSDRPGGLTALAVVNFLYGIHSCLSIVGLIAMGFIKTQHLEPDQAADLEAFRAMSWSKIGVFIGLEALIAVLLLLAGVGYIGRRKWLGRWGGNLYALVGLGYLWLALRWLPPAMGGSFSLLTIFSLFYPVFTLGLVNLTFRRDLCR